MEDIKYSNNNFNFVYRVSAVIFNKDKTKILLFYGNDSDFCMLPGGKVKEFEKSSDAIKREIKEEIGFEGVTGMYSRIFDTFVMELIEKAGTARTSSLDKTFSNTKALSADVDAAYDPNFASAFEKNNTSYLGKGMSVVKYTGSRGKAGSSEAPCEFVAEVRNIFEQAGAKYQCCELGKVDKGGGGTIALTLANRGMDVLDVGVPVMGMHSPYEITSKYDIYQAYKGYKAFYNS